MSKTFDFYFDLVSPYSYLAATQMESFCKRTGATCVWKPFFLGGVMQATGNKPPLSVAVAPKSQWMTRDLADWADYYGVKIAFPTGSFPFNTLKLQRAIVAAGEAGAGGEGGEGGQANIRGLTLALFERLWGRGGKFDDAALLADACPALGLDAAALLAATEKPEIKEKLKANTEAAVKAGAFGAPSFVYKGRMYWGNDRLCILEKALSKG